MLTLLSRFNESLTAPPVSKATLKGMSATRFTPAQDRLTASPVTLIIPTFRRPDGLKTALESVFMQKGVERVPLRIVVCDNSPEGSARAYVEALTPPDKMTVVYLHEPNPGVANARNAALKVGHDPFIVFLDDDEDAPPYWLSRMLSTQCQFKADVVFGPVIARLKDENVTYRDYFESFFSRTGLETPGLLDVYFGCGNSLIRRDSLPRKGDVFSLERNNCGGEDDKLFYGLQQSGARIAWAPDAVVHEDVPESRSKLGYTLKRAFAYGQGPSTTAMAAIPPKPVSCAYWMLNGLVQMTVFGIAGGVLWLVRAKVAPNVLDKAARGAGKLLWFPPFKMHFYGTALLKKNPAGR